MLKFPNCKINLGLHLVSKRKDGYHNIETVFYPVNWCDALEILKNPGAKKSFDYKGSGLSVDADVQNNLVYKAWKLMNEAGQFAPLKVRLMKNIPMGAGLGGGSADAAFFLKMTDELLGLKTGEKKLLQLASTLGSDCAFFIKNKPLMASGRGDVFSGIRVDLSAYYILVVYPGIHSNTREAYQGASPGKPKYRLKEVIEEMEITEWKNCLVNDFEKGLFIKYPAIKQLKHQLYDGGAIYASMSGSGSAVYGIFETEPKIKFPAHYRHCLQKPGLKLL